MTPEHFIAKADADAKVRQAFWAGFGIGGAVMAAWGCALIWVFP